MTTPVPQPTRVHFLYDANSRSTDPDYHAYWCACGESFGAGKAAAVAHIASVNGPDPWQALRKWLAAECEHDQSVMESYRDYPDDGATSKAHGALLSAKRSVLAKMAELEEGK